jgi:hypothetical protein
MHQSDWGQANRIGFVEGWGAWKARLRICCNTSESYISFAAGGYIVQNTELISKPVIASGGRLVR